MVRHRALQNDAKHIRIIIHPGKAALAFFLRQLCRPVLFFEGQTDRGGGARLSADIEGNLFDLANADGDQLSDAAVLAKPR